MKFMRQYLLSLLLIVTLSSGAFAAADLCTSAVISQTDASNGSGTQPSWLGSAAPSTIDDAGRALQGAIAREYNWRNLTVTAGGTADAKTLTYAVAPLAYCSGQQFAFIANTTNTGSATLNVNTLGAKTIKKDVAGTMTALAASDMPSGTRVIVMYDGTDMIWVNWQGSSASAATTSAEGISQLSTTTEVLTGTEAGAVAVTPDSLAALWEAGSDITDGATVTIGEGGYFNLITSTTAITAFTVTTDKAGRTFRVRFDTARTLTHNATSLIIPGGASITTAQGDIAQIRSLGSGNVVVEWYQKKSGLPIVDRSPVVIKKAANQSVAAATVANDSDFTFSLAANTKYIVRIVAKIGHDAASDFKFDITGPASPTSVSIASTVGAGNGMDNIETTNAFSSEVSHSIGADATGLIVDIFINNGVNAGTFQFRWSNVTGTTSNTMDALSYMTYQVVQ